MCRIETPESIRNALAWSDRGQDEDAPEPYEQTYRDGSMKNECWRSQGDAMEKRSGRQ
ncbi:MAG: hypothetical protein Q4E72_02715 [bacterium]|nr:hypothetical protein [bacterium]